jgi:regulatory protein
MQKSARNKMMDYLARRDHSEKELRTKLQRCDFSQEEIEKALDFAKANNWLPKSEELSEKVAQQLHQKKKGTAYINMYLEEKGLPPVMKDSQQELEKALLLAQSKWRPTESTKDLLQQKQKIARFLGNRGFDMETIHQVFHQLERTHHS